MRRIILPILILSLLTGLAQSSTLGNPARTNGPNILSLSGEFAYLNRDLLNNVDEYIPVHSVRYTLRPQLGFTDWLDVFLLFGAGNAVTTFGNVRYGEGYEFVFGGGLKSNFLNFEYGNGYIGEMFGEAKFTTFNARGEFYRATYAQVDRWVVRHRYYEYTIGVYGATQFETSVTPLIPYIGVNWTYFEGTKSSEEWPGDVVVPIRTNEYFRDPTQWPRPVIGLDIYLGRNVYLSLEAQPWTHGNGVYMIGISSNTKKYAKPADKGEELFKTGKKEDGATGGQTPSSGGGRRR